jgi:hypothetical protein
VFGAAAARSSAETNVQPFSSIVDKPGDSFICPLPNEVRVYDTDEKF